LGIHGNFTSKDWVNESSVSLVIDGVLSNCVAEERLTRIKVDGSFPKNAVKDILNAAGLTINDIDQIAITSLHPTQTNKKYLKSATSTYYDTGVCLSKKIKQFGWNYIYNLIKTPQEPP